MHVDDPRPNWYLDPLVAAQKRAVHLDWIRRNVAADARVQTLLKTDLFEEAYGKDELLFSLPFKSDLGIGCDIEAVTVQKAAARHSGDSCGFMRADVRMLPLQDGCVDVVLSNSTLDHFNSEQELEDSLSELARVLKPGGILLVTLDNPRNPLFLIFRAAPRWLGLTFFLGKTVPMKRLHSILESTGLDIRSTDWLIHNPRFVSTLIFLVLRRSLGCRADAPIRWLLAAFSKVSRLPTRGFTGAFIAVCASKPGGSVSSGGLPATESHVSGNMKFSPYTCSVSKQPVNRMESAW
jgi:SAM-dependent methyltransferase